MSQVIDPQFYANDEIDLRELFATLWRGKWLIVAITLVSSVLGVGYALYKPNVYQASALLAPSQGDAGSGIGSLAGQLGGLASLAGISLGGGGSNQTVIAKEVIQSRAFLGDFFRKHNLEIPLMAVKGWNETTGEWVYDRDVYNPETNEWLPDDDGGSHKPTNWEMVERFKEDHFSVGEARDTGMITVSVKHYSPIASQKWTQWLVRDLNEHMRAQDVKEAETSIAYLEQKLKETTIAGMQQVFYQLIESETRKVMLANAREEYVFKTVDPAVVPEEKSEPKRALICLIAAFLGLMLGVLIVFIKSFVSNSSVRGSKNPQSKD